MNRKAGKVLMEFADKVFAEPQDGVAENIGFGPTDTEEFRQLLHEPDALFANSAQRFPIQTYATEST
jgi:hypothetical protein